MRKKTSQQQQHCAFHLLTRVHTNKSIILWFAFIKSHHSMKNRSVCKRGDILLFCFTLITIIAIKWFFVVVISARQYNLLLSQFWYKCYWSFWLNILAMEEKKRLNSFRNSQNRIKTGSINAFSNAFVCA